MTWLPNSPRSAKGRKQNRKNQYRPRWRASFNVLGLERLEDRVLLAADLTIDKTVAPTGTVVAGESVVYTITLAATANAASVTVTDALPSGFTFIHASDTQSGTFTLDGATNTLTDTNFGLISGTSDSITIQGIVNSTASGTLSNTATASDASGTVTSSPATVSMVGSVPSAAPNVSLAETGPGTVASGDAVSYTVKLTNSAANAASNVAFVDQLDPNETFFSASDTAGTKLTYDSTTRQVTGTVTNIGTSSNDTVTIVTVPGGAALAAGSVTNSAFVSIASGNAATKASASATTTVTNGAAPANVALDIGEPGPGSPQHAGDVVEFDSEVINQAAAPATNVAFAFQLDSNQLLFSISDTAGSSFRLVNGVITGTVASIAGNNHDLITIRTIPTPAAATAGSMTANEVIAVPGGNGGGSTDSATTTINPALNTAANVAIAKSAPATGTVGSPVSDTITLTNKGTAAATNVAFIDTLGANVSNVSASDAAGDTFTFANGQLTGTIASLAIGATTFNVVYTPTAAGAFADTASIGITGGDQTSNASLPATTTVNVAGVLVSKTDPATAFVGDMVADFITLTNIGSAAATNVAFSDKLSSTPAATFVSATDANGSTFTYDPATNTLSGTIGGLAANGGKDVIILEIVPTAAGTLSDTATAIVHGATTSGSGSTTVSSSPAAQNVSVAKSVPATGAVGDVVADKVTLTNAGAAATTSGSVMLFDVLGPNQTFVSASDSLGNSFTFIDGTVRGRIASIPSGASNTDTITIDVLPTAAGTITDLAGVAVTGGNSANTASAGGSTTVAASTTGTKVNLVKTAPATALGGDILTETLTLANAGSSAATNVAFVDQISTDQAFVSATDSAGTAFSFSPATNAITGTVAGIAPSAVDTVTIKVIPVMIGMQTDTASITIAGGNQGTATASATTNVGMASTPAANVAIKKTAASATANVGSEITTTVTLANTGSAAVTNAMFIDELGPGQTFLSASDAAGDALTFANGQVSGTIANIPAGAANAVNVTIVTLATAPGTADDSAVIGIAGGNQAMPAVAHAPVTVSAGTSPANVSVAKSAPATGTVGSPVTDTITLTNAGPAAVTNVAFVDTLGTNVSDVSASDAAGDKFTFVAVQPAGGAAIGGEVTGTVASLATGATTVTVVYTPTAAGTFADSAAIAITGGNQGTPSATGSTTVSAATSATLTITKSGPSTGQPGTPLTYTITVSNSGGAAGSGASVTDVLPAGLTNITATDAAGTLTIAGSSVTDVLGSLAANGGTETLTIVATPSQAANGTTLTNNATLTFNGTTQTSNMVSTAITAATLSAAVGFRAGVPGDDTPQTFVENLYRELLGRDPDSVGDAFWVAYATQHDNAAGHTQVVQGFLNSPEYAVHYLTTVYEVLLGRAPDAGGLKFWTEKMGQPGTPGANTGSADEKYILAAILGSDEFYLKSGNTPQSWINALYEDLLGRAADGSGLAFWANELATRGAGDRGGIVRDLLTTPEAAHDLLDSFYPAVGGISSNPLPAPGAPAGSDSTDLAIVSGGGWENLYLEGSYDSAPQANDGFFASLAGGGNWDDVQLMLLETSQFYSNPDRPITH